MHWMNDALLVLPWCANVVLRRILEHNRVALVVNAFADEPFKDTEKILGIDDLRLRVGTIDGRGVVAVNGTPVDCWEAWLVQRSMRANNPSMRGT